MSNRLTFSLASLFLLIVLIAAPVMVVEAEPLTPAITGSDTDAANTGISANGFALVGATETTFDDGSTGTATPTGVIDVAGGILSMDLEMLLARGVTIALLAPKTETRSGADVGSVTADPVDPTFDIKAKDVVISEIMWGRDEGAATFAAQRNQQYVELYNTTGVGIALSNWRLYYVHQHDMLGTEVKIDNNDDGDTEDDGETYLVVDVVGNLAGGGWTNDIGQNGRVSEENAKDLISMYRNINYDRVQKTHNADDATANRNEQLKDFPNGNAKGSWKVSTRLYNTNRKGTPGAQHFKAFTPLTASTIDRSKVIINEIGNHNNDDYDWIEIRNLTSGEYNLKNHHISYVKHDKNEEVSLVNFKDVDVKIPANGIILILATNPDKPMHPIAGGVNIKVAAIDRVKKGVMSLYYIDNANGPKFALPDADTLIILRNAHDKTGAASHFLDVVGGLSRTDNSPTRATSAWPLIRHGAPHGNAVEGQGRKFTEGGTYKRNNNGGGTGEKHWSNQQGYTGVGYKRGAVGSDTALLGGTPGYDNGAVKEKASDLADGAVVIISEIMYQTGRNLPQWIELHNNSDTQAINLNEWKLKIETSRDDEDVDIRIPSVTIQFGAKIIPPNQPILIVTTSVPQASDEIDVDHRVIDLFATKSIRDKLEIDSRRFQLLSTTAFKLTLMQKGGNTVDVVGNLGDDGMAMWALPMDTEIEGRSSVLRRHIDGEARNGTMANAWTLASMTNLAYEATYYGNRSDVGTPGFRAGGALPVSLSKFRPERMKDTGEIVIRWVTESELNNAGFNILRSETRNGAYTQLNNQLIKGQGTTSERTVYEYADTSAKPNVVYYYQIQDVSLDGNVTTLRTTHLRGNVTAVGKATTTWGELKTLRE